jgi:hypothetical protein
MPCAVLTADHLVCLLTRPVSDIDGSLYDMDIVFDPPGSGLFSEVYLYEELMEADLHAIVRTLPFNVQLFADARSVQASLYRMRTSSHSCIRRCVVSR